MPEMQAAAFLVSRDPWSDSPTRPGCASPSDAIVLAGVCPVLDSLPAWAANSPSVILVGGHPRNPCAGAKNIRERILPSCGKQRRDRVVREDFCNADEIDSPVCAASTAPRARVWYWSSESGACFRCGDWQEFYPLRFSPETSLTARQRLPFGPRS